MRCDYHYGTQPQNPPNNLLYRVTIILLDMYKLLAVRLPRIVTQICCIYEDSKIMISLNNQLHLTYIDRQNHYISSSY